jgi:hypothetical protein
VETLSGQALRSEQVPPVPAPATRATPARTEPARGGAPDVHGLYRLRRGVEELATRGLKPTRGNTRIGRSLARWRGQLIRDLGGDPSTAQLAIVDLAARTRLMLDSVDAWLLTQPSLVNKRKRCLLPVVTQRQILADALARYLQALGLERKAKQLPSLAEVLSTPDEEAQP